MPCLAIQLKWDETEQRLSIPMLLEEDAPRDAGLDAVVANTSQIVHIMSALATMKTSVMETPSPWVMPLRWLQRITGDCIYAALMDGLPFALVEPASDDQPRSASNSLALRCRGFGPS